MLRDRQKRQTLHLTIRDRQKRPDSILSSRTVVVARQPLASRDQKFCSTMVGWLLGFYDSTRHKTIRLSEWVTPGDTAIPGMTSLKDGDLQHSSALAQSPKEI